MARGTLAGMSGYRRILVALDFSEPNAGSDLANVRTRGEQAPEGQDKPRPHVAHGYPFLAGARAASARLSS